MLEKSVAGQAIVERMKKNKRWHHDIKFIDGEFVEEVVKRYQVTGDILILEKIVANWSIFRDEWARAFAPYLDGDLEAGSMLHDEVIWRSARNFRRDKCLKPEGYAFNAYVVSALLNQLKNFHGKGRTGKHHPEILCPLCGEWTYALDGKHLKHLIDIDRYVRKYPTYPLLSIDGRTKCPYSGVPIDEITVEHVNRIKGKYETKDFRKEAERWLGSSRKCPVSGLDITMPLDEHAGTLMDGYTGEQMLSDYPELRTDPVPKESLESLASNEAIRMLLKRISSDRLTLPDVEDDLPFLTIRTRMVDVVNPYTGKTVPEITIKMLAEAKTTWKEHMGTYATIVLGKNYPHLVTCPFTGRKMKAITREHLQEIGRTPEEFYVAVCEYPLRKWQVRCACCGDWVDNIWTHLQSKEHYYAPSTTSEEFELTRGTLTKLRITNNSYVQNDSGDTVHLADLFGKVAKKNNSVELEDSLLAVAKDDLDKAIARAFATEGCQNVADICFSCAKRKVVRLPKQIDASMGSSVLRDMISRATNGKDFDIADEIKPGRSKIAITTPSRSTIKRRLVKMVKSSDLAVV
jgi:hypothetical protein